MQNCEKRSALLFFVSVTSQRPGLAGILAVAYHPGACSWILWIVMKISDALSAITCFSAVLKEFSVLLVIFRSSLRRRNRIDGESKHTVN